MANKQKTDPATAKMVVRGMLLNLLVSFPVLLGAGILLTTRGLLTPFRLGLGTFVAGFSGIIVIILKEMPSSFVSIRGKSAVRFGFLFTFICWGTALYFLLFG